MEQLEPTAYVNPYKFNAKELDSETGLYYYGARYYNPRLSIWYGVDPLAVYNPVMEAEFYGDGEHNGGVYYWGNLNPYIYTYQNPIRYIDPNGKQTEGNQSTEAQRLSEIVTIRGKKYHKNTTNLPAKVGNIINSWFGGDSDYFVEKKPYDPADDRFIHELVDTSAGALIGGGISKLAGPLLSNLVSKIGTKVIPNAEKLLNSMLAPSKGGMSVIGRALQKHAGRTGSTFENVAYSGKTATDDGMGIIKDIVNSNKQLIDLEKDGTKTIYDKVTGRGFNVNRQGEFGGFRELPQRNINNVQKVIKK